MLDRDLAQLYGVETKRLNQQVQRNIERFPEDFMFQLSREEAELSRSQFATLTDDMNNLKSQFATSTFVITNCDDIHTVPSMTKNRINRIGQA